MFTTSLRSMASLEQVIRGQLGTTQRVGTTQTMVGARGTGADDALPRRKRRRKTSLPTRQKGKLLGAGVHDLLDGPRTCCPKPGDSSDTDIEAVREQ